MAKDPVCGMEVSVEDAAGETVYKGNTYYFCAPACKKDFDKEPERYVVNDRKTDDESSFHREGY